MPSRKSAQAQKIEELFVLAETATVKELYEALYGDAEGRSDRELSQAIGPALSRYFKRTGNSVAPTGKPYTYSLQYA
jgi:hypothetical protein